MFHTQVNKVKYLYENAKKNILCLMFVKNE